MGGVTSGVTESTTTILLESAYFDPSKVRATSRALILTSDSSYRFERGVDPQNVMPAASRALQLILEIAGGSIEGESAVVCNLPETNGIVELDVARLDQLMGGSISLSDAEGILQRLWLTNVGETQWPVPSRRAHLPRPIAWLEEIARFQGLPPVP